jgi:hypothetical protein
MANKTFKTNHDNEPKVSKEHYPVWKQRIRRVLMATKAYIIVTSVELLRIGNGVSPHPLQPSWHDRANRALAQIHLVCSEEVLPIIDALDHAVEMWEELGAPTSE